MPKKAKKYIGLTLCVMILWLSAFLTVGKAADGSRSYRGGMYVIDDQTNIVDYHWSPDGSQIAYIIMPDGQNWGGELWVADKAKFSAKLTNSRQIVLETGSSPAYIDDWYDDWIFFHINDVAGTPTNYNGSLDVWKIKADGTELTQLTFTGVEERTGTYPDGIRWYFGGAWKNRGSCSWARVIPGTDGALMYISAHAGGGWWMPYTCTTDGSFLYSRVSDLTEPGRCSFTIAISPTGNKLVWGDASYWNDPTTLYASNVDGSDRVMVKSSSNYRLSPLLLADGTTLIHQYHTAGYNPPPLPATLDGNIYAINLDGTNERTVLDDDFLNYQVDYHPLDGQAMLMRSNRDPDGNWHIFNLNVTDDSDIVQLTDGPFNDMGATYSPDALYIMYVRLPEDFVQDPALGPYPYQLVIKRIFVFPTTGFSFVSILLIIPVIVLMKRRKNR